MPNPLRQLAGNLGQLAKTGREAFSLGNIQASVKEDWLLWLVGLQYVPAAILSPWLTKVQTHRAKLDPAQQTALFRQEVVRQTVSATIHFATYFPSLLLVKAMMKGHKKDITTLAEFGTATLMATIGHGILKPLITNSVLMHWLKNDLTETMTVKPSSENLSEIPSQASPVRTTEKMAGDVFKPVIVVPQTVSQVVDKFQRQMSSDETFPANTPAQTPDHLSLPPLGLSRAPWANTLPAKVGVPVPGPQSLPPWMSWPASSLRPMLPYSQRL